MKPTYSDAGKLAWYPDIACPVCGGDVNSWDKRCSRALGYRQIVCEGCISEEYMAMKYEYADICTGCGDQKANTTTWSVINCSGPPCIDIMNVGITQ